MHILTQADQFVNHIAYGQTDVDPAGPPESGSEPRWVMMGDE